MGRWPIGGRATHRTQDARGSLPLLRRGRDGLGYCPHSITAELELVRDVLDSMQNGYGG